MYKFRKSSLDQVTIPNWRWKPFLDYSIQRLNSYAIKEYSIPDKFLDKEIILGSNKNSSIVKISTWACQSQKIKFARAVCLEANKLGSVLNFVITPKAIFDLPFFGADFVTLPNGHLIALDLQPALKNDSEHTEIVWKRLIPLYQKWQKKLPQGGPIPDDAKPYFSPGFLWTRIPLGKKGDQIISDVIYQAFTEYLSLFLELLSDASEVSKERSLLVVNAQRSYFQYRAQKDPARGMLNRFYGNLWTEEYINEVLFNLR
tara:strand:+ start:20137 stop:20913 length:777 start_codon:yes stop_codon:yes gene_type:complete